MYMTTMEKYPEYGDTLSFMEGKGYEKVMLVPFILVAGDNANNDMAGDNEDSLKSFMERAGFEVECLVRGFSEFPEFRKLFMNHIDEAITRTDEC